MRKRTILALVAILIIASIAKATPVDPQQAIQVAQQFVPKSTAQRAPMRGSRTDPSSSIVYTHMMPNSDRPAFYIVNVDDGAFVLVSADDIAHQVLGYSLNSTWPVSKDGSVELPEHIKGFFDDLAAQMEAAVETEPTRAAGSYKASQSSSTPNRSPSLPDSVGPLLTTTWNQGQYYNALCPEDANGPDGHVYTGCVATAMAQIVKYWSDSTPGRGTHSYSTNYGTLTVNYAEASYDYANMPDVLDANSTQTQIDAVAQLIYHCGVATNMDYSFNESSSYDIDARAGLINFFRFSPDLSYAEKATFSNDEWNNLLIEELVSNRPVLYSGHGNAGGHCFVCDGYKSNNYYHFNFGWGGMADGWYLTNSVNPSGIGFNSSQTALIGIMPDTTKNVILSQMAGNSYFVVDKPIELYHLLGHNKYKGLEYNNPCNSTITFYLTDTTKSVVLDVMKYDNQGIVVYDGLESFSDPVRTFWGSDYSKDPFVSSKSAITLKYDGALVYDGFRFHIGENNSYRMVSNIDVSVESNSVSLKWNENGTATSWKVEYGLKGFQLNHGVSQIVSTPFFTVDSLNSFSEYDFYISPIYEDYCAPFNLIAVTILAPYWHNVVTKQPLGYSNIDDIVEISTAEELTWWANHDIEKSAKLIKDIDLGDYLWKPIKYYNGHFDGNCHIIKNMHINENDQDIGFISELTGVVENLGMSNCEVKGTYRIGTLCGLQRGTLLNCFVKGGHVAGIDEIGGLIGNTYYGTTINCYANTNVSGYMNGILVGKSETKSLIQNCYAYGTMVADDLRWNGSISAYAHAGTINHCYGTDTYNNIVGYKGSAIISDTSLIRYDARTSQWQLNNPIQLDGVYDSDLLCVLNKGVTALNDSRLRLWIEDSEGINDGLPVFGGFYNVVCPNVSGLSIRNAIVNENNCVIVEWDDTTSSQWDIRYYRDDLDVSQAVIINTANNPDTLYGIQLKYVYNFNVRARIDNNKTSGWGTTIREVVDLPLWNDIVTECPNGYIEDDNGDITISTAEGLAWLSVLSKRGQQFEGRNVILDNDIDLKGYRWLPIGYCDQDNIDWHSFKGLFEGNNHSIKNVYVNCNEIKYAGLFGYCDGATIRDVSLDEGSVRNTCAYNPDDIATGGLIGHAYYTDIINCSSTVDVYGVANVGSLCGYVRADNVTHEITNCFAKGNVEGREGSGGLAGFLYGSIVIKNCYATGNVSMIDSNVMPWYVGGLVGNFMFASAYNCFSIGNVDVNSGLSGKVIGCPYINTSIHYLYGLEDSTWTSLIGNDCEDLSNISFFREDSIKSLITPVTIKNNKKTSLIDALNSWVASENDQNLKIWIIDSISGYPTLGSLFVPVCYNPTDLKILNATAVGDSLIHTEFSWNQIGNPKQWEIMYVAHKQNKSEGVIIPVNKNPSVLTGIPVGHPLDFYVRAICDSDSSNWSTPATYIPDKLRWTEVVKIQPEGYQEDANGNIYISSAEGLAWLSSVSNGLNNACCDLNNKKVLLINDIDISEYRWTPIGKANGIADFSLWGNGHTIKGMYCNELSDNQGLFANLGNGSMISNLSLIESVVYGECSIGALAGNMQGDVINCCIEGNVYGIETVGGIMGHHSTGNVLNSYFIGNVVARNDIIKASTRGGYIGGICGVPFDDSYKNCFVVSEIADTVVYSGIITGTGGSPDIVANCYYKSFPAILTVTSENSKTKNNSSFTGNGSSWELKSQPYVNGAFRFDLVDALNAWVDENDTLDIYRYWVADTANINGGFPILVSLPKCIVTFKNANDVVLQVDTIDYGLCPIYRGSEPVLESNSQFIYTFIGWSSELTPVTGDITFTAVYDAHMFGDVTDNASVDVQDATIVVNYILGERSDNYLYYMADMNNDTEIDVFDLTAIINVILGRTSFQAPMRMGSSGYETTAYLFGNESTNIVGEEDIYLRHVSDKIGLSIANASRFTSFQMDVEVPDGAELQNVELTGCERTHIVQKAKIGDNLCRVIALSMSSQPFADVNDELVSFQIANATNTEISVSNVMFVTPKGEAHYFNGASTMTPTIINEITTDNDEVIFDLSGRRIYKKPNELERGVYIIDKKKVVIK